VLEQDRAQRHPRFGPQVGGDQQIGRRCCPPRVVVVQGEEPQSGRRCPDRPGDADEIAGFRLRARQYPLLACLAECGDVEHQPLRRLHDVAADNHHPVPEREFTEPPVEFLEVAHQLIAAQPERHHRQLRIGSHRGQVGDIDGEDLVPEAPPVGPVAPKMDALDKAVRGHDHVFACRGSPHRGVIADTDTDALRLHRGWQHGG
jgi:hypothetical protein